MPGLVDAGERPGQVLAPRAGADRPAQPRGAGEPRLPDRREALRPQHGLPRREGGRKAIQQRLGSHRHGQGDGAQRAGLDLACTRRGGEVHADPDREGPGAQHLQQDARELAAREQNVVRPLERQVQRAARGEERVVQGERGDEAAQRHRLRSARRGQDQGGREVAGRHAPGPPAAAPRRCLMARHDPRRSRPAPAARLVQCRVDRLQHDPPRPVRPVGPPRGLSPQARRQPARPIPPARRGSPRPRPSPPPRPPAAPTGPCCPNGPAPRGPRRNTCSRRS